MPLDIRETKREGVVVLELEGRLVLGESLGELRSKIQELASAGETKIVLDLGKVDYIDSSGLGQLVVCYTSMKKTEGGLRLANLHARSLELMVLTKLHTVFEIFGDATEAVNSFFPERQIRHFDILSFVESQKSKAKS
jgi:anti-sigma B factor antagonist